MNKKTIRLSIILVAIISLCAEFYFYSQSSPIPSQPHFSTDHETTIVRGEVLGRDGRTIIVRTEDAVENITIHDYADITRNTFGASVHHIRPHDIIAVTMTGNHIRAVNAVTGSVFFGLKTAFISMIGLIILLGTGFAVLRKIPKTYTRPSFASSA